MIWPEEVPLTLAETMIDLDEVREIEMTLACINLDLKPTDLTLNIPCTSEIFY